MSSAAICAGPWTDARIERLQPWIAALSSALLHLLMLLILLYASTPIVTTPQGAASGSRVRVDFIGQPRQSEQIVQTPQDPPPSQASEPVQPPAGSRVQSTLVEHADDPVPPPASTPSDTRTVQRSPNPVQRPREPQPRPQPPTPDSMEQSQAQAPATHPPPSARRRPETWTGRPPGLIAEDAAPENAGLANSPAISNGRGRDMTDAGPSMELGGYLVYYDVLSEARLRAWAEQGMKELYIPLPGTRYYMICPLEIALKRESGKCRALEPESPQMQAIGDARKAVTMLQVYKQGELVWRGPGPYR